MRDEKADYYVDNVISNGRTFIDEQYSHEDYCAGFDEAVNLKDEEWRKVVEPLLKALKYYADKNNWLRDENGWRHDMIINDLDDETLKDWDGRFSGKMARKALEEYEKKVGEK